ncbi:glycosyltransferase family 39 protein [Candidatus Woesearchaeota archaeon]|nr:glycosyltransferase family 39 protein [Candidatus Woesearchaeota archaeon]
MQHTRKGRLIAGAIGLAAFLIGLLYLRYHISADVVYYAELAESIYSQHAYWHSTALGIRYATSVPPLYSLVTAAVMLLIRNPVFAIKAVSALFFGASAGLSYLLARQLGLSSKLSLLAAGIITFNPFYSYFLLIIAGNEALSAFLLTLSVLLFITRKPTYTSHLLLGLVLGLFALTRLVNILIVLPFVIYLVYEAWKRKEDPGPALLAGCIGFLFVGVFFLMVLAHGAVPANTYLLAAGERPATLITFVTMLAKLILGAIPLALLFAVPGVIAALGRPRDRVWDLLLIALALFTVFLAAYFPQTAVIRARQFVPFVPALTILAMLQLRDTRAVRRIVSILLILSFLASAWLTSGYLKDLTDPLVPLRLILPQRQLHRAEARDYVQENLGSGTVVGLLDEAARDESVDRVYGLYFRQGIDYVPYAAWDREDADYLIADYTLEEAEALVSRGLEPVFTTQEPVSAVYRITG